MVALVTVVTDTKIWLHKQPYFRITELLHALCRAKRGKNSPPRNRILPEAGLSAPAFFMSLPLDAIQESVTALNVSGVRCLTEIGGVANEAIPCLSYICKYKGVEMINRAN